MASKKAAAKKAAAKKAKGPKLPSKVFMIVEADGSLPLGVSKKRKDLVAPEGGAIIVLGTLERKANA